MSFHSNAERRAGFSLLEMLASLAIVAALASAVLPFARDIMIRWWAGAERGEFADHWMRGVSRLSEDLGEMLPVGASSASSDRIMFQVGLKCLRFVRRAFRDEPPGLRVVTYRIERDAASSALVRSFVPLGLSGVASAAGSTAHQTIVLRGQWPMHFEVPKTSDETANRSLPPDVRLVFDAYEGESAQLAPVILAIPARAQRETSSTKANSEERLQQGC